MNIPHPGILDRVSFHTHFDLRCYEPCDELKPYVVHIWTQRHRTSQAERLKPLEIFSGPNIYLFFTKKKSFIHAITPQGFNYKPQDAPVVAGVKFRPGGFHAFWKKSLANLNSHASPLAAVFPEATDAFINSLLDKSDVEIVKMLERLMLDKKPVYDKKIDTVHKILKISEEMPLAHTVKDIARTFGRSERSLQQVFHQYVGVSLKWVIVRRRLLYTVNRVLSSNISWTTAAAEAGYSNQSHFTREFKQATGQSPSEYLKKSSKFIQSSDS